MAASPHELPKTVRAAPLRLSFYWTAMQRPIALYRRAGMGSMRVRPVRPRARCDEPSWPTGARHQWDRGRAQPPVRLRPGRGR